MLTLRCTQWEKLAPRSIPTFHQRFTQTVLVCNYTFPAAFMGQHTCIEQKADPVYRDGSTIHPCQCEEQSPSRLPISKQKSHWIANTCRHQALERDYPLIAPSVAIGTYRTMAAGENVLAEADDARLDCPGG